MGYKSPMMEPGNLELGTYNIQECVRLHTNSSRVETKTIFFYYFLSIENKKCDFEKIIWNQNPFKIKRKLKSEAKMMTRYAIQIYD